MSITFDDILTKHIGNGKVQIEFFLIIALVDFLDGSETLYLKLLNGIIYTEWNLTLSQLIVLSSVFHLGLFFGALMCGFVADNIGRRVVLIFGCFVQVLAVFCIALVQNLTQLIILRILMGALYGLVLPLSQILLTEITPINLRGRFIVGLQISFIIGYIWTIFLGYIFLESLMRGNWRAIALCNVIPCLICFFGCLFILKESPRFLICQGKIEEGVKVINHLGRMNNENYQELTDDEIAQLGEWRNKTFHEKLLKKSFKDLFNSENLPITWRAYSMMILMMLLFSGIFLILPFLMDSSSMGLTDMLYTILAEIPAVVIVYLYIDSWGRLPIAIISNSCNALAVFVIWYWKEQFLLTGLLFFKFFLRSTLLSIVPLILESYSTLYRSLGVGSTFALGRIIGFISPALVFPLYELDHYLPFLGGFITLIFLNLILISFPKETAHTPLDQQKDEQKLD